MSRLTAPFIYMGLIFLLSSVPGNNINPETFLERSLIWISPGFQNLLHIPLFFGLALTWIYALEKHIKSNYLTLLTAFALSMLYGIFDEFHQIQVPGRYGSISDLLLDALGAVLIFLTPLIKKIIYNKGSIIE
ncbi:VanZ family protein [Neptunomonas qingdaonensis]|uniref:VanZ like family protein n=1 Tax=Neptunomonas qingdaonensis TaxID=1045558 RepID=A0A1I2MST3_9GAMM|nr:VanZ family protein [Neptunomonas qingdaonensis]SFF94532.1 VanZ like family protein [Neptunomonas qingdaonensis]